MIVLASGGARAEVIPEMGGGLAGLWVAGLPVLRPWSGRVADGPFALACNLLVPFSNRISRPFPFGGTLHPMAPNLPGEACAIHGDAFQRRWTVAAQGQDHATLALAAGEIGPFRYSAQVTYRLTPQALATRLSVTSTGPAALPFGLGLHPWFPRSADTRLAFAATGQWPETADHLPATQTPQPLKPNPWEKPAALPDGWINMGFSGWDGQALVAQGPQAVPVRVTAAGLETAILYSPSAQADFFCFEPVSHPVDAHNLPGQPGLTVLAPGESLMGAMTLTWTPSP